MDGRIRDVDDIDADQDDGCTDADGYVLRTQRYKEALYRGPTGIALVELRGDGQFTAIPYGVDNMDSLTDEDYPTWEHACLAIARKDQANRTR